MLRFHLVSLFAALGAVAILVTPIARADESDDAKALMADCDRPDLPSSDIRDCIERAREIDYVRPSPQLQRLITQLERRWDDGDVNTNDPPKPTAASSTPHALLGASEETSQPRYARKDPEKRPREIRAPDDGMSPGGVKPDSTTDISWWWPF